MHLSFFPYGARWEVEYLLRDMESQKFYLPMQKEGKNHAMPVSGFIKQMPMGFYEYIFPREYLDVVLATLKVKNGSENYMSSFKKSVFRKMLKLKPIPKYKEDKKFLWNVDAVGVIGLGIREDKEITDSFGEVMGWSHEAL